MSITTLKLPADLNECIATAGVDGRDLELGLTG